MRKAILLGAIVALGSLSFGCSMTDYGVIPDTTNKSHGVIDCGTHDRFANTQQTLEPATRDLFYTAVDPVTGNTICPGFDPAVTSEHVSREDAKNWNRQIGMYSFQAEAQVFSPFQGTYAAAGVKELADGSIRLNTFGVEGVIGTFSCVGSAVNGLYGGPEGLVAGDGVGGSARIPGFSVDNIAIDRSPGGGGIGFCANIVAVGAARAANGFSVMAATTGRGGEGHLWFTPITRRGNLSAMLSGLEPIQGSYQGLDFSVTANLDEQGMMSFALDSLTHDGVTYEATSEPRLSVRFDPAVGLRAMEVHAENVAELRSLAAFMLNANLTDVQIDTSEPVLDLGLELPTDSVLFPGDFMRRMLEDNGEDTAGF